ncbi:MAG: mechanosensitive ion channel family protein [Lachnospiraceae bacterium]
MIRRRDMTLAMIWVAIKPLIKMALILVVGHFAIVYLLKLLDKTQMNAKADQSLLRFLRKTINIVLHIIVILSALTSIGVSTTGLVATLSAATVGIAVALKDSLSNVAGGILLLFSPRFSTGDYIAAGGDEGTVVSVDLMHTTVVTVDHKQISIPNGVLINSHIINYSSEPKRRVDIMFPISYEADVNTAKRVALDTMKQHPLTLEEPEEAFARIRSYGDSSVNLLVRVWCNTEDYWNVYFDLTEQIREALEEKDILIPYNQLDVNIRQELPVK